MFRMRIIATRLPYGCYSSSKNKLYTEHLLYSTQCNKLYPSFQPNTYSTQEKADNGLATRIYSERREAGKASPVQITSLRRSKKREPLRVSNLYDALVYQQDSRKIANVWKDIMAVTKSGQTIDADLNKRFTEQLETCRNLCHGEQALSVLNEIEESGYIPSGHAFILAMESCIPAEDFAVAERIVKWINQLDDEHPSRSPALLRSARTLLAITYSSRGQFTDALRVMKFHNYDSFKLADASVLIPTLDKLHLGRDTLAWGVLLKSLTKLRYPQLAVNIVNVAMQKGVGMTDSLLHLTIDALRMSDRWEDAHWLFNSAIEKGIQPKERTIASMLLALTSRKAKKHVYSDQIESIVDKVEEPTQRFLSTSLLALSIVGSVQRCEAIFAQMQEYHRNGIPEENSFGMLLSAYGNYVDVISTDSPDDVTTEVYDDINAKADMLWTRYLRAYRIQRPIGKTKFERSGILSKYLRAKVRCFKVEEAVEVLEEIVGNKERYPYMDVQVFHVTTVLGAVEMSCDVKILERLLNLMKEGNMRHDVRSVAFVMGTHIGDGNLEKALSFMRSEAPPFLSKEALDVANVQHHRVLLLRRLELLSSGLRDKGLGKMKDVDHAISLMKARIYQKPTGITPL